jgi:hypothetical protein
MNKHTILFLAANPSGTDLRALDLEARSIGEELRRTGYRDRFEFVTWWAAEPLDLLRKLRELRPTVVHFSGRGGRDGLLFQPLKGGARVVPAGAIAEAFGVAGGSVRLVVLSACYGEAAAEALRAHVDCVIGTSGELHEVAARSFATGFYGALGDQASVATAYLHGKAAISLEGLADAERPQLRVRAGCDPTELVLTRFVPAEPVELPCPYPGMRPYSGNEAEHFYGRTEEVDELIGQLRAGEREIYVIGPSASGKSSIIAAGLLPQLARARSGPGPFVIRSMRPGEHPTARLREELEAPDGELTSAIGRLLQGLAQGASVLLVLDQLEELFTLASAEEREAFLPSLRVLRGEPRCVIVSTLRADFLETCMKSPLWPERRGRFAHIHVVPLRDEALREAIACPAQDLGVLVEPGLVQQLLAHAGSEPGALPLLQEVLVQLWDRRRGPTLALADYQALGGRDRTGFAVALARRADVTLHALSDRQEAIARRILLRLISFGEGRADTRRQQPRGQLRATDDDPSDFDAVLRRLIDDRLLTTDDDGGGTRVDLAHEVMITAWPALADWLRTYRSDEQRRRQLEAAAAGWIEHGRGAWGLLDPHELVEVEAWLATPAARELGASAEVAALVEASRAAQDREREARRRQARWFIGGAAAGIILLLTVIAATALATARTQEQELQRDTLQTNAYAAHAYAGAVAFHLRQQIDAVVATAADPVVERLLHAADHAADDDHLQRLRLDTPFESLTLFDRTGTVITHVSSVISDNIGKDYAWRDYFQGVRRLGEAGLRAGYISRVVRSEDDGLYKFGIAAPVYSDDTWAGVLLATIGNDFALRRKRLDPASEAGPMAVVVAPQDRSRTSTDEEGTYLVILHEGLPHGARVEIDSPRLRELRAPRPEREQLRWIDPEPIIDDDHRDPVPGYEGRWLAGFASVGDTGFVVIVQTRHDAAVAPNARLSRRLASRTGIALLAWLTLCTAGVWLFRRRQVQARR